MIPLFFETSCALAGISCIPRKYVMYTKSVIRVRPEVWPWKGQSQGSLRGAFDGFTVKGGDVKCWHRRERETHTHP